MTATTSRVEEIIASLSDVEKRQMANELLCSLIRGWKEPRIIRDQDGTYLGDIVPARSPGPYRPISEEMRLWMSKRVFKSRDEWAKDKAAGLITGGLKRTLAHAESDRCL